jgi:colicin import membrane protein
MSAAALKPNSFEPPFATREREGSLRAFALALFVHGLLAAFLFYGIRWQSQPPGAIEAELWAAPPAAPKPQPVVEAKEAPPPKPEPEVKETPPPKPDIAIKDEKKKPEPKKEVRKEEPKAPANPFAKELMQEQARRESAKDAIAQAAAREAANASNSAASRGKAEWIDKVAAKVRANTRIPDGMTGNPRVEFEVTLLPTMEVLKVTLKRSSGNPAYDEAAERAINRSSPLPPPPAGVDVPRVQIFSFTPK